VLGQGLLRAVEHLRGQPTGRGRTQHLDDRLMAQPDLTRGERRRRGRQPRRQHLPVEGDPLDHLPGRPDPPAGLPDVATQQISHRLRRTPITPLGEHPLTVQPRDHHDRQLLELPRGLLTHLQRTHPGIRPRRHHRIAQLRHRGTDSAGGDHHRILLHSHHCADTPLTKPVPVPAPRKVFR
jgi:hypothetical protein